MVTIELSPFDRPTVHWFVMQYLFKKANGDRMKGEEYVSQLYRQWEQFCGKKEKPCGNLESFSRAFRKMKMAEEVEKGRVEKGKGAIPRQYYILSQDYFDAMKEESEKVDGRR